MNKYILIRNFIILLFLMSLVSCSRKTDNEYWYDGVQKMKENKNKEAIEVFDKLVKEYPQSNFTSKALFETAKLYQTKNVKDISIEESFKRAIQYYDKLIKDFPNDKETPSALFMVAFIEANQLNDYQSATRDFNLFLSKYPNHQLTSAAKLEMENMGKTPEEILNNKLAVQKNDGK